VATTDYDCLHSIEAALRATLGFPSVFAYDVRLDGNSLNHRVVVPGLFSCQSSFRPDFVRTLGGTS